MSIQTTSEIEITREFVSSKVGDETAIFDEKRGVYIWLSAVGTDVVALLENPKTVSALVDELLGLYAVDRATCETEVIDFLNDMKKAELISVS